MKNDHPSTDRPLDRKTTGKGVDESVVPGETRAHRMNENTPVEGNIPTLDEILTPDETQPGNSLNQSAHSRPTPPVRSEVNVSPDADLDALVYQLRTQFSKDLEQIVHTTVSAALEDFTKEIEEKVLVEISESIEARLDRLLFSLLELER